MVDPQKGQEGEQVRSPIGLLVQMPILSIAHSEQCLQRRAVRLNTHTTGWKSYLTIALPYMHVWADKGTLEGKKKGGVTDSISSSLS